MWQHGVLLLVVEVGRLQLAQLLSVARLRERVKVRHRDRQRRDACLLAFARATLLALVVAQRDRERAGRELLRGVRRVPIRVHFAALHVLHVLLLHQLLQISVLLFIDVEAGVCLGELVLCVFVFLLLLAKALAKRGSPADKAEAV